MDIETEKLNQGTIVIPTGEIDMSSSGKLRNVLQKLLKQKCKEIIVSLEKSGYIDSSGLATLIECMQESQKYGGVLKIIVSNPQIMEVFKLARLDRVFKIYESRDAL